MKKSKHQLEDHYCGDEAWMEFARVVRASSTDWNSCASIPAELVKRLSGYEDIACVMHFCFGERALAAIDSRIDALDGKTPVECVADEILIRRLKSMLMRMPC